MLTISLSQASVLTEFHGTKGQADKELEGMVSKLESIGFTATAKNKHIETHYYNTFKEKNLDLLNFYTILDKESLRGLLIKNPDFGAFAPFNLLAFKKFDKEEGGDTTWYGHLNAELMLKIIGEKDEASQKKFINMVAKVDKLVLDEMKPTANKKLTYDKALPSETLIKMTKKIGDVDDMDDFVDDFIVEHDSAFVANKFIIAGFTDMKAEYEDLEMEFEEYDYYWVSSLCHFSFSNTVFNHGSPHAGVFAPCSIYFYVLAGSDELHVGYVKVENWIAATGIADQDKVDYMQKIADDVLKTFKQLGFTVNGEESPAKIEKKKIVEQKVEEKKPTPVAPSSDISSEIAELKSLIMKMAKDIEEIKKKEPTDSKVEAVEREGSVGIVIPTAVTAVKPITLSNNSSNSDILDRGIKFSKRMPPNYISSEERYGKDGEGATLSHSKKMIGDVDKGRISAYLRGELIDAEEATNKLKNAGFTVLVVEPLDKKKKMLSIVFTNEELKKMAKRAGRGHVGTLRLLIDPENKQISITNPLYLAKAFMQIEFDESVPKKILASLNKEFTGLRNSYDKLKFQLLAKYQFMSGMPFYKDAITISKGSDLLKKVEANKKRVSFVLDLGDGSTLIGVKLGKRTKKFPKKIGVNNAGMLPYPLLIENGEAKILDPKYYLSLMYPQLKMEGFMAIASTPDAIVNDCKKVFR